MAIKKLLNPDQILEGDDLGLDGVPDPAVEEQLGVDPGTVTGGGEVGGEVVLDPGTGVTGGGEVGGEVGSGGEPIPPPLPAPVEPPLPGTGVEPPPAIPGPIPVGAEGEEVLPLAPPPPVNTATGLQTFGVGGSVPKTLRTPSFSVNRSVGGNALLEGIAGRFGPGIPVVPSPLPSGGSGDDSGRGVSDEELLKSIRQGRRR